MAWDSTRRVPWKRLTREWLLYVGLATVAYVIYYKMIQHKTVQLGLFAGLLSSGPMYLLFGAVLCKFGYQRKTMKDLRAEREARPVAAAVRSGPGGAAGVRNRPAPTKRTTTGASQYHKSKPKRR